MKCNKCDYEWDCRVQDPKSCPRCKRRFDYPTIQPRFEILMAGNSVLMIHGGKNDNRNN